jgi:DNA invertase Pin-like site-specific DNA recombinase
MPGADALMMRVYAAMAQKERELISERTKAALGAAKARGARLGGRQGLPACCRPRTSTRRLWHAERLQSRLHIGCCWK